MRLVEQPKVFLVAEPVINTKGMLDYLREVGGEAWFERVFSVGANSTVRWEPSGGRWESGARPAAEIPAAEGLVEFCGRLCYKSWEPGLNANVTKVREARDDYLLNVLRSAHGSVLAHAHFTFAIHDLSRVCTAELNRHAAGTDISEQSLRYVRLEDVPFWEPSGLSADTIAEGRELVQRFEAFYERAVEREGIDGGDFSWKKTLTSKLRRWAPLGIATEEAWTGNVRSIRHVVEMRTAPHAEEEIRIVANEIGAIMAECCPLLFGDYELTQDGVGPNSPPVWDTPHRKV